MNELTVSVEDDPVPIIKVLASQFRRSAKHVEFQSAVRGKDVVFALASSKKNDPQRLTISIKNGNISLSRGIDKKAQIVIHADLDNPEGDVKVKGLFRHPLLALRADKILKDYPDEWQDVVREFWNVAKNYPDMPSSIHLHCTDDDSEALLATEGNTDHCSTHFYGTGKQLASAFGGGGVLVEAVLGGKLKAQVSIPVLVKLSEVSFDIMMGDQRK